MQTTNGYPFRQVFCLDSEALNKIERELNEHHKTENLTYLLDLFAKDIEHPYLQQQPTLALRCAVLMQKALNNSLIDWQLAQRVHHQFQKHGVYKNLKNTDSKEDLFYSKDQKNVELNKLMLDFESPYFADLKQANNRQLDLSLEALLAFKEYLHGRSDLENLACDDKIVHVEELFLFANISNNKYLKALCLKKLHGYAGKLTSKKCLQVFLNLKTTFPQDDDINIATVKALASYAKVNGISSCAKIEYADFKSVNTENRGENFFIGIQSLALIKQDNEFTTLVKNYYPGIYLEQTCSLDNLSLCLFLTEEYRLIFKNLLIANTCEELHKRTAELFKNITSLDFDAQILTQLPVKIKKLFPKVTK